MNIIVKALVALGRKPDYKQIQRYILSIDQLLLDYCKLWLLKVNVNWEAESKEIELTLKEHTLPSHLRSRSKFLIALINYI